MDSSNWKDTGLAGAIGRTVAGFLAPNNSANLADIVAKRTAAQPDQAKLLANPDPFSELANNGAAYSPLARAMVLNGATPTSVADERLKAAQGAMYQAKAAYARQQGEPMPPTYLDGVNSLAAAGPPQGAAPQNGVNLEIATNNFAGMRMPGIPAAGGPASNPSGWQRFATPQDGLAAISHQLDRYANGSTTGQPVNTLRGIVSTWAPATENPTAQLIARASQVTGFDPDQPLNVSDPTVKAKLIEAMIRNEQGGQLPVDPKLIAQVAADPNATAMAVGGAIPPASGSSQTPAQAAPSMPPGVAQLAAAGQPQAPGQPQSTPPMSPGVAQLAQAGQRQINPALIAAAQRRANTAALLGEQAPQYINEIAGLPFVEPKAQAQASGTAAGELPFVGPKTAAQEAEKINISRSGAITKGGTYIGHVPLETSVVDAAGNKYPAFTPPMGSAAGGAGMPPPGSPSPESSPAQPSAQPSAAASGGFGTPPAGAVMSAPSELGPGAHQALVARAKEEQETRQKNIDAGSAAQMQQATLQNMKADTPNFYTGPFADHYQQAASILRLIDPSWTGQVSSYEDFTKNAGALTRQAVHDTSPRAAVQEFKLIGGALPNPEMSPAGLNRVLNEYQGLNDYHIAKSQAQQVWEQQHGGPGNVTGFETDWQAKVSPHAFIVARMDPVDRQKLFSQVAGQKGGAEELAHLGQQIQYITKSGMDQYIR